MPGRKASRRHRQFAQGREVIVSRPPRQVQANRDAVDTDGRCREIVLLTAEPPLHAARAAMAAMAALPGVRSAPRRLAVEMLA
jgi:hypothetical protein